MPPALMDSSRPGWQRGHWRALIYFRGVDDHFDISWTMLTPRSNIVPNTRTGEFRLGGEIMLKDERGEEGTISMEDYAVAMLNEIEDPQHINERFTVAY
jgi:uncharacterized protein